MKGDEEMGVNNVKFTYEYVKEYFESFGYTLISKEYKRAGDKLNCICPNGHEWSVTFNFFKNRGVRCPKCQGHQKYSIEEVRECYEKEGYTLLSNEYKGNLKKMDIMCNKGHIYQASFSVFKRGQRCPYCSGNAKLTYEYVKEYIEKEGYTLISNKYEGAFKFLTVCCDRGHEYDVTWANFHKGRRCPHCKNNYKGEKTIKEFLEKHNIEFITQYSVKELYYKNIKNKLKYDFYLPSLNICIEYDGRQHFEPVDFANKGKEWALEQFELTKIRDNIKNKYCEDKDIKLIRIPYWEIDSIEEILKHEIFNNLL